MPPLESRFTTVAVCLDALRLGEPAKLNMTTTTTTVRGFAIVATFSRWRVLASSDEPRPQRAVHSAAYIFVCRPSHLCVPCRHPSSAIIHIPAFRVAFGFLSPPRG